MWVAGGIGVTPFLSWLRALGQQPPRGPVDFFYTSADPDMPYADEIRELAVGSARVRAHLVDSRQGLLYRRAHHRRGQCQSQRHRPGDGHDTVPGYIPAVGFCFPVRPRWHGPRPADRIRRMGVPGRHIYRERFDWRLSVGHESGKTPGYPGGSCRRG